MKNPILVVSLGLLLCFSFACQNKAEKAELEKFRAQAALEEQNKALVERSLEAWSKGESVGMPPTGTKVEVSAMEIWRIENGKVVEIWSEADMLGLNEQLGLELRPKEVKK